METEAILQFVKIKDARPSLGAVKCLHLKIKLLLQVFRASVQRTMAAAGSKVKSKNTRGCHPVTLLSLIYYFSVTQLSLASLKLFWNKQIWTF